MKWYENAVFYHIYPLGLTDAPKNNAYQITEHRLNQLGPWIKHIKEIVFTERYGVIEYADNLVENHQKNNADTKSNVSGWSGSSLAERLQNNAELKDIQFQIFNICDKLFLQVF